MNDDQIKIVTTAAKMPTVLGERPFLPTLLLSAADVAICAECNGLTDDMPLLSRHRIMA
jgi:hypothetical protein